MATIVRAAAVQMNSQLDKQANLATAERLVAEAAGQGAQLIVLPELFNALGDLAAVGQQAEPVPGPTSEKLASWASRHSVYLCGGSLAEQSPISRKAFNTSLLFDPEGRLLGKYRKMNLFDVDLPGLVTVRESDHLVPGNCSEVTTSAIGKLGTAICYDLRFPSIFEQLARHEAEILLLPAAFTAPTGKDHWQALLRARAIENQAFVVAANQAGSHGGKLVSYGHSQLIDPWGKILATAGEELEAVVLAELDFDFLREVRRRLPVLAHRTRMR